MEFFVYFIQIPPFSEKWNLSTGIWNFNSFDCLRSPGQFAQGLGAFPWQKKKFIAYQTTKWRITGMRTPAEDGANPRKPALSLINLGAEPGRPPLFSTPECLESQTSREQRGSTCFDTDYGSRCTVLMGGAHI